MNKVILSALVFLICSMHVFAQKKGEMPPPPKLPIDKITKKITYDAVTEVQGVAADTLYKRALRWFHAYYKNPTEVIRENDSVERKIVGKPRFKIYNPADKNGLKTDGGVVQYTITVAFKEGRFKYEITDLNWKQASNYPCEKWYDTSLPSYSPVYSEYLLQTDNTIRSAISDLKKGVMKEKPVKKNDW